MMGNKRRSDKHHDIGDSKPGETGDKRPARDAGDTPMERIHSRRSGDVSVPEPSPDNESKNKGGDDKEDQNGFDEFGIPTGI
jgi:hypothetical protein